MAGLLRAVAPEPALAPASELEAERRQTRVRLAGSILILAYLGVRRPLLDPVAGYPVWLAVFFAFIVLSFAAFWRARHAAAPSSTRRLIMLIADIGIITYGMIALGAVGIPLFVLYFVVALGNGLRFGRRAMILGAALGLAGFALVLAWSPVWDRFAPLALAVVAALALLPASAGIIRRRNDAADRNDPGAPGARAPSGAALFRRLRALAARRPANRLDELGRERGHAAVRLVNATLVIGYFLVSRLFGEFNVASVHWVLGGSFVVFALLLYLLTRHARAPSAARRVAGNVADVAAVTYAMTVTGSFGIPLFILYLSVALGNGFRFGLRALVGNSMLCLAGFGIVYAVSPVWQALPATVPLAVAIALLLLPAYSAHLVDRLAKATKRAEEASAAKSRFLARMSHELRTPLSGILGTAELLSGSKRLTREERSLLDIIRESVKVSMRQIDNILDFSKIEAGKLVLEPVSFDLHALLNRAARVVRASAQEKRLRLMLRIDPAIPYRLVGDPHHLSEVLLNLLSNAIKFTRRGYVSLEAHLLERDADSALIRLEVWDTGIGIEPSAIDRIFEAFVQEDGSTTRRYGGTGLGTTIAKQLVELMDGELRVESTKGKGTRFYADIRLPVQKQDEEDGRALAGLRVLLVGDEGTLERQFAFLADDWGVSLTVARSFPDALGLLARGIRLGNPINAVLADARAIFAVDGSHVAGDFIEKAWLSATPVFLVCDVRPNEAELRELGYAGILSRAPARPLLFHALRASSATDVTFEQGVVHVEPWAWQQEPGRPRPRLLIADDNRTNLMILQRILESAGYAVDTAENGEEALERLLNGRYKAAVVDMQMPGLDGLAVIKQYRSMASGARTPVIMLTANATMDAKLESAEAGADAYLTKPATAESVLSTIRKLLDDREVYELRRRDAYDRRADDLDEVPVLDAEVVGELARLYEKPEEFARLLDTFEMDGTRLLDQLQASVSARDHAAFREFMHALKGNSANIGAYRLSRLCMEMEGASEIEFYRDGKQMLARIQGAFAEAMGSLQEYTSLRTAGQARGSDAG
ncbi:MAG TPA: ATP-binding protein [Burkholderiales bacterium]